jgi:hypothetical protein
MFATVIGLFKKYPVTLPFFSKNVHQGYQTFQILFGNITGLFGKNEWIKRIFPLLIAIWTLPDFSENVH